MQQNNAKPQETPLDRDLIENFLQTYRPGENLVKPDQQLLDFARNILPPEILYLWQSYGFGSYGGGLLKVVNPGVYWSDLCAWLGRRDPTRVPIMMTAFGDVFYYRKLGQGEHDISLLDVHYRKSSVCAWSFALFLKHFLQQEDVRKKLLREELYHEAVQKLGPLQQDEIFFFVPALVLGGGEALKYVQKGDARVHHRVLLERGR